MKTFEQDLIDILNKHSVENESNSPNYALTRYIQDCLDAFNNAHWARNNYERKGSKSTYRTTK